jgi:hypothetical protein
LNSAFGTRLGLLTRLEVLQLEWGSLYEVEDLLTGYRARRHGSLVWLEQRTLGELRRLIETDHKLHTQRRKPAGGAR